MAMQHLFRAARTTTRGLTSSSSHASSVVLVQRCFSDEVTKTSTGYVGLEVDADYRNTLTTLFTEILDVAKGIPEGAPYRVAVEANANHLLEVVKKSETAVAIEEAAGLGQVEEIAEMARSQLDLLPEYIEDRAWETVDERNVRLGL